MILETESSDHNSLASVFLLSIPHKFICSVELNDKQYYEVQTEFSLFINNVGTVIHTVSHFRDFNSNCSLQLTREVPKPTAGIS